MMIDEPVSDAVRERARQLIDAEILRRLDPGTGTHPCMFPAHAAGLDGCNSAEAGDYVVEFVHGVHRAGDCTPNAFTACRSKVIQIRSTANRGAHCPKCGLEGALSDFVRVVSLAEWLNKVRD